MKTQPNALTKGTKRRQTVEQQATAKAIAENPQLVDAFLKKDLLARQAKAAAKPTGPTPLFMPEIKPEPPTNQTSLF